MAKKSTGRGTVKKKAGRTTAKKSAGRAAAKKKTGRTPAKKSTGRAAAKKKTGRIPAKKSTSRAVQKKKKTPGKARKTLSHRSASQWQRVLLGISALVLIVVAAGYLADRLVEHRPPPSRQADLKPAVAEPGEPQAVAHKAPKHKKPETLQPVFEVYPKKDPPPLPRPSQKPPSPDQRPKVAIIIDDLGYNRGMADKLLGLDPHLTASILPNSPFQKAIAAIARDRGIETMLHLPMEPNEYPAVSPGPGALLASMPPDELIAQLNRDLDALGGVKGVNNHMGSRLTRESDQMHQIFSVLKQRKLYFIDSRTSAQTVGRSAARLFKVPFAERDIFLDHDPTPGFIRGQIAKLVDKAIRQGQAVGIAHPHEATYDVLEEMLPELRRKVRLVPASQVVYRW